MNVRSLARFISGPLRSASPDRDGPADKGARPGIALCTPPTVAEVRARELLLRILSPAQREEFQSHGYFAVDVAGRGRFCILPSTMFNVIHMETGDSYCALPRAEVPLSDLMLSQKLLLENDPGQFFSVANRRREFNPGPGDDQLRLADVLRARRRRPSRVRWTAVSMIPYDGHLP